MDRILIPLHVTGASIVIGVLFLQSMMVVMALRLQSHEQKAGLNAVMRRIEKFIYYPILGVTLLTGFYTMKVTGALDKGVWLHYKFIFLIVLVGLGAMLSGLLRTEKPAKAKAMVVHVLIFLVSFCVVYLAVYKP